MKNILEQATSPWDGYNLESKGNKSVKSVYQLNIA